MIAPWKTAEFNVPVDFVITRVVIELRKSALPTVPSEMVSVVIAPSIVTLPTFCRVSSPTLTEPSNRTLSAFSMIRFCRAAADPMLPLITMCPFGAFSLSDSPAPPSVPSTSKLMLMLPCERFEPDGLAFANDRAIDDIDIPRGEDLVGNLDRMAGA